MNRDFYIEHSDKAIQPIFQLGHREFSAVFFHAPLYVLLLVAQEIPRPKSFCSTLHPLSYSCDEAYRDE